MAHLAALLRRLDNGVRAYERLADAHRLMAARSPAVRSTSLRTAAHFDRLAASRRHRRSQLQMAVDTEGITPKRSAERVCLRCGRTLRRGLVFVDRLADGTERWECRSHAVCLKARAAEGRAREVDLVR